MNDEIKKIASWLGHGSINVIGCPFSGKDTQGEILVKLFNGVLIGGGDILRSIMIRERLNVLWPRVS